MPNGHFLQSPTSENRSSSLDTLGFVNIIRKSTGRLEKSRCPVVHLDAILAVEKMHCKSRLPIKPRSIRKRHAPVVLYLNSIMIWMMYVDDFDDEAEYIDQGNLIFASSILPPHSSKDICALSTISTHLVEAFKANLKANAPPIPEYLKKFSNIFSQELRTIH
jgi:hypothetical protein